MIERAALVPLWAAMVFGVPIQTSAAGIPATQAAATDAVIQFISRFVRLQNMQTEFDQRTIYTPPPDALKVKFPLPGGGFDTLPIHRETSYHKRFAFLNGMARFESVPSPDILAAAHLSHQDLLSVTTILAEERGEELVYHSEDTRPIGHIVDQEDIPMDSVIDISLGLRLDFGKTFLSADALRQVKANIDDHGNAIVQLKDSNDYLHQWTFDATQGWIPMTYTVTLTGINKECEKYIFSDVVSYHGVLLPKKINVICTLQIDGPQGKNTIEWVDRRDELLVSEYKVDDPANTDSNFQMLWPKGTSVLDERTGTTIYVRDVPRNITDRDIYEEILKRSTTKPMANEPTPGK